MTDHPITLAEILDAVLLEEPEPTFEALTRWSERYPEHTDALARFFAIWVRQAGESDEAIVDEEALSARGVSYAMDLLHQQDTRERAFHRQERGTEQVTVTAISDTQRLLNAARAKGLSAQELAHRTDLDHSVIQKFDRRRIKGTIPRVCLERISDVIDRAVPIVRTMVTGPPLLSAHARHKAKRKPAPTTESFADAIRRSSLPEETQRFWLDAVAAEERDDTQQTTEGGSDPT
jgi:hypothetical protein